MKKTILINKTVNGAEDGIHVVEYAAGKTYDVLEDLAKELVKGGFAAYAKAVKEADAKSEAKPEAPKEAAKETAPAKVEPAPAK